ncbi:putative PEP-binding protein [Nocardia sp. NPDC049220]
MGNTDLTRYALATERGNNAVARLVDPLDPACCAWSAATRALPVSRCAMR